MVRQYTDSAVEWSGSAVEWSGSAVEWSGSAVEWSGSAVEWSGSAVEWSGSAVEWSGSAVEWSDSAVEWSDSAVEWSDSAVEWSDSAVEWLLISTVLYVTHYAATIIMPPPQNLTDFRSIFAGSIFVANLKDILFFLLHLLFKTVFLVVIINCETEKYNRYPGYNVRGNNI